MNNPFTSNISKSQPSPAIIFPFNRSTCKFKRDIYIGSFGQNLSSNEVNKVLDLIELATCKIPTTTKIIMDLFHYFLIPLITMIMITNVWPCTSYYCQKKWAPFAGFLIASLFYFVVTHKHQIKRINEKIEAILKTQQSSFEKKGLRWVIPAEFPAWIELHRNVEEIQQVKGNNFQAFSISASNTLKQIGNALLKRSAPEQPINV